MLAQASASTLLALVAQPSMLAATASHASVLSLTMVTQTPPMIAALLADCSIPPVLTQRETAAASTLLTVSTQPPMLAATASHAPVFSFTMVTQTDAPALLAQDSLSSVRTPALVRSHRLVLFSHHARRVRAFEAPGVRRAGRVACVSLTNRMKLFIFCNSHVGNLR